MSSTRQPQTGLMRNLGRFFGHIVAGAKSDPDRRELKRTVEEEQVETTNGQVTLRRTVIEEIEYDQRSGPAGAKGDQP